MKLLLKILFCILSMFITMGEVKSSTVINLSQEGISGSLFQEVESISFGFENHSKNSCLNGRDVVSYSELGTKSYGHIAEVNETWYKTIDKETLQEIYYYNYGRTVKENKTYNLEKYTTHVKNGNNGQSKLVTPEPLIYKFIPSDAIPESDCWLKKENWFWCK